MYTGANPPKISQVNNTLQNSGVKEKSEQQLW